MILMKILITIIDYIETDDRASGSLITTTSNSTFNFMHIFERVQIFILL